MLTAAGVEPSGFANSANPAGDLVLAPVRGDALWSSTGTR